MRLVVFLIILAIAAAAFYLSQRAKPLLIDNHPTATPATAIVCVPSLTPDARKQARKVNYT